MYSLFTQAPAYSAGQIVAGVWPSVKEHLQRNIERIVQYHYNTTTVVDSAHMLVNILTHIGIPKVLNTDRYYANLIALMPDYSMAMQLTSTRYPGKIKRGVLYGVGVDEAWIASNEEFDYNQELKSWKTMRPIRVLKHPRSDLSLVPLDGKTITEEQGMAIIELNLPKLAIMYRAFVLEERAKASEQTQYVPKNVLQFVSQYVLTNALYSHLDVALFNRFSKIIEGLELGFIKRKPKIGLPDYTQRLDYSLYQLKDKLRADDKSVQNWLSYIPAISQESMSEVFQIPDYPPLRNIYWALNEVLEPILRTYCIHAEDQGASRNGPLLTKVDRLKRKMQSDSLYANIMPIMDYMQFNETLQRFSEIK